MSGRLPEKDSAYHLSIDSKIEATDERIEHVDDRLQEMVKECKPFYQNSNLLKLYLLIGPGCLMAAVTLGFDSAMLNGLQAVPAWLKYFGNPQGATLGILSAVLPLGACCATPFISMVGDRFGRRKGIVTGSAIMFVGAVIQGASVHIAMFLISRFIIGFGLVFANTYAPVLIGELAHPKDRQVITSLYQTSFYLGSIAAAWVTFGTFAMPSEWSWRIPSLLQCVPATIQMCSIWFLPESPRWLLARGRREEARAVLIKYHANDDEEDVLVQLEFAEMQAVIEAETANKTPWKALIATPGNRRRLLIIVMLGLFSQWSGNGLISYYLAKVLNTIGITHARDKNIINGSLQIFNWLSAVASAFLTAYLKRRTQFLISVCGMLVVFTMQTLLAGLFNEHHNKHAGTAVVPMLFLFYVFYNLAFNALLYSYPVELLPYPIRAKGFSVLMFFGKAANFVNTFVNPIGLSALGWKYYIVYVAWLVVEILFVFFFIVETKGPSLEAIAAKFDKKNLVIHHDGTAVEKKDATA